ncbi:AEC family transporter [Microvirga massiliensis]|uniref:AEC family transporter n=1 Tax=Microvirga massiliensis TaxID=1033741 RepID=UPI00062B475B|nr:AEC family transporter [Microvirga massiliensis]
MLPVFASLVPVFLLVILGWTARVTHFVQDHHWVGLERVTYVMFFPALVINTLVRADLGSVPVAGVGGALFGSVIAMAGLLIAMRPLLSEWMGLTGPSFTSLFQGATRWNTFVAIALAGSLFGQRGVTLTAVAIAAMVPLLNVLALFVFVRFAGGPTQSTSQILRTFATNPFIWSCAVGIVLNPMAGFIPEPLLQTAEILGRPALAAGLIVVGAGLDVRSLARPRKVHLLALALKLLVMPTFAAGLAALFGISGQDFMVVVIAASVPTASAAYLLSRQLGGDAPLMAEILTQQTLAAIITMPVMLALLAL